MLADAPAMLLSSYICKIYQPMYHISKIICIWLHVHMGACLSHLTVCTWTMNQHVSAIHYTNFIHCPAVCLPADCQQMFSRGKSMHTCIHADDYISLSTLPTHMSPPDSSHTKQIFQILTKNSMSACMYA